MVGLPPVGLPPVDRPAATAPNGATAAPAGPSRWPLKTVEHIDLWLHAFALLSTDSTPVPLYRTGYRDSLTVVKNRLGVLTALDNNRGPLASKLASSPGYLQAQFLPLDVGSFDVLRAYAERLLQLDGDVRRADKAMAPRLATMAAIFPTESDREWLRQFIVGVSDEQTRFFLDEYSRVVRSRAAIITAVDSLWQRVYRPRFERFLTNSGQRSGDLVLSVAVGPEGRTGLGRDKQVVVVVPFPDRVEDAAVPMLVFAHEITGAFSAAVVADNTTPAEQREGVADRYVATAQVRAGAMLLERVAPELLDAYLRLYLGAPSTDARPRAALQSALAARFALPSAMASAMARQLDIVLGGI